MNKRQLKLTDYEGFTEKFKPKKTTDDCYTPQPVMDAVVEYVDKYVTPLQGREIVRPFWPGGDYGRHEYPEGCIVIDNPPFSIMAQILKFYVLNDIDFFLFAAGLTLFDGSTGIQDKLAYHIVKNPITFENGANVSVGFITNVRPHGERIVLAGWLDERICTLNKQPNKKKKKLIYPKEVVSSALLRKFVSYGYQHVITDDSCHPIAKHEAPFGGGMMVASCIMEDLERERERERLTEVRPMSAAFHEQLRRLNEKGGHPLITDAPQN